MRNAMILTTRELMKAFDLTADKRLHLDEYRMFEGFIKESSKNQGVWYDPRDYTERNYNMMNALSEDEGVTEKEYWTLMLPFMKMVLQKAKDGNRF